MCVKKIVLKCFRRVGRGGGVVNITDPEDGPTATGMIPEGGTAKQKFAVQRPPPPPPHHRLISGTALIGSSIFYLFGRQSLKRITFSASKLCEVHSLTSGKVEYIVHSVSSGKVEMFLCAACHAFTPHVNAWKH